MKTVNLVCEKIKSITSNGNLMPTINYVEEVIKKCGMNPDDFVIITDVDENTISIAIDDECENYYAGEIDRLIFYPFKK